MSPRPGQKTVLITGCSPGGIGHALAREFHRKGLHVIATARKTEVISDLAALGMSALPLDVTKAESIRKCHEEVSKITGGKLDMLVNNAGRTHVHPATDIDLDDARETFETNVFGVMAMCQAFTDHIIAARGLIINIASISVIAPYAFGSVYTATKAAVASYSRTMRLELEPFGVRVMVAMAGTVRSQIVNREPRTLPPNSIYQPARHVFEWRQRFSQENATVETDDFARKLVAAALRPEMPRFLRTWFGRPDWFYAGGMSKIVYYGHTLGGEWLVDAIAFRIMRMNQVQRMVQEEARKRLK